MASTDDITAGLSKHSRIGVLMGGRSAERAVSLESGTAVLAALRDRGWEAIGLDVGADPCLQLQQARLDAAFVVLHGRYGEDGCIQGLLESIGLPYTGSGVLASAVAMDKVLCKLLFVAAGLPTPAWVHPVEQVNALRLGLPLVLKPRAEGSSVGLVIVRDSAALTSSLELLSADQRASLLAEAFVAGRELSVAVLGTGDKARVLGSVEIRAASGVYDYEAKYERDDTEYLVPAPVSAPLAERIGEIALHAHRLLGCTGATRADFRWSGQPGDDPQLLELNTLPGMTSHSLLPKIAAEQGMSYAELVEAILFDAGLKS